MRNAIRKNITTTTGDVDYVLHELHRKMMEVTESINYMTKTRAYQRKLLSIIPCHIDVYRRNNAGTTVCFRRFLSKQQKYEKDRPLGPTSLEVFDCELLTAAEEDEQRLYLELP